MFQITKEIQIEQTSKEVESSNIQITPVSILNLILRLILLKQY